PTRDAYAYVATRPLGLAGKGFQGEAYYTAPNPPFGATFTYYLKEAPKTKKQLRQEAEREAAKKNLPPPYATPDQLRAEAEEEPPALLLAISDTAGNVIRTIQGPASDGMNRISWDLRAPAATLPRPRPPEPDADLFGPEPGGPFVMPG